MTSVAASILSAHAPGSRDSTTAAPANQKRRSGRRGPAHPRCKAFWPTIPQLYVKGEFVGGCDIVREMLEAGELTAMFDAKGVAYDKTQLLA